MMEGEEDETETETETETVTMPESCSSKGCLSVSTAV